MARRSEILIIADARVAPSVAAAILEGVRDVVSVAQAKLPVRLAQDEDVVSRIRSREDDIIASSEWLFIAAQDTASSTVKVNADKAFLLLETSVWEQKIYPYYVLVTSDPLRSDQYGFTPNWYRWTFGAAVSIKSFENQKDPSVEEHMRTLVMHAAGHMFGLLPEWRVKDVVDECGPHCANQCVMKHPRYVPGDWTELTRLRLKGKEPFCRSCAENLRECCRG